MSVRRTYPRAHTHTHTRTEIRNTAVPLQQWFANTPPCYVQTYIVCLVFALSLRLSPGHPKFPQGLYITLIVTNETAKPCVDKLQNPKKEGSKIKMSFSGADWMSDLTVVTPRSGTTWRRLNKRKYKIWQNWYYNSPKQICGPLKRKACCGLWPFRLMLL
jgi:hypothetical protein